MCVFLLGGFTAPSVGRGDPRPQAQPGAARVCVAFAGCRGSGPRAAAPARPSAGSARARVLERVRTFLALPTWRYSTSVVSQERCHSAAPTAELGTVFALLQAADTGVCEC